MTADTAIRLYLTAGILCAFLARRRSVLDETPRGWLEYAVVVMVWPAVVGRWMLWRK